CNGLKGVPMIKMIRVVLVSALTLPSSVPTQAATFEVLHTFAGSADGSGPLTNVIQATDGNFYGTTPGGGAFDAGVVFRVAPGGADYTILHAFAGGTDGAFPYGALIEADDGNFYGTTASGGGGCFGGCGTVFRMVPDGAVTVLHAFTG